MRKTRPSDSALLAVGGATALQRREPPSRQRVDRARAVLPALGIEADEGLERRPALTSLRG